MTRETLPFPLSSSFFGDFSARLGELGDTERTLQSSTSGFGAGGASGLRGDVRLLLGGSSFVGCFRAEGSVLLIGSPFATRCCFVNCLRGEGSVLVRGEVCFSIVPSSPHFRNAGTCLLAVISAACISSSSRTNGGTCIFKGQFLEVDGCGLQSSSSPLSTSLVGE